MKINKNVWLKVITLFALLTFCTHQGYTQPPAVVQSSDFTYSLNLTSLSFSGDGIIRIRSDDNTIFYDAPHWNVSESKPVGYKSGSKPKIACLFNITGTCNSTLYVKGESSNGMLFPSQQLRLNSNGAVYDLAESNVGFESGKTDYFENYKINWYFSDSPNASQWTKIGTSQNKIYVTKGQPLRIYDTGIENATFHSTLYLGCKYGKGQTSDLGVIQEVYKHFKDKNVESGDNRCLQYWGSNYGNPYLLSSPNIDIELLYRPQGLLKYGEGTCNAWSLFFIEIMRTQGINGVEFLVIRWATDETERLNSVTGSTTTLTNDLNSSGYRATTTNLSNLRARFFVNSWNISNNNKFELLTASNLSSYTPGGYIATIDNAGVKGQCMDNPWSSFTDHVIVRYQGIFYDPSYGSVPTSSIEEWQTNSITFFGTFISLREIDDTRGTFNPYIWIKGQNSIDKVNFRLEPQHQF